MSDSYGSYLRVPGHQDLLVEAWRIEEDCVSLAYLGLQEDLIAAGLCTEEMLAPRKQKGPKGRFDSDGERYCVQSYFVSRQDQPVRRFKICRYKSRTNALRLLGAREAIARYEKKQRERELEQVQTEKEQRQRSVNSSIGEPATTSEWKERQLASLNVLCRTFHSDARRCYEEYLRDRGAAPTFRFSAEDSARLDALITNFQADFAVVVRQARLEDLRPGDKGRSGLRLVVNNGGGLN